MPCSAYMVMSSSRHSIPSYDFLIPIPYHSPALETISFPPTLSLHSILNPSLHPPIQHPQPPPPPPSCPCSLLFQTTHPTNQPKKHPVNPLSRFTSSTSLPCHGAVASYVVYTVPYTRRCRLIYIQYPFPPNSTFKSCRYSSR